MATVTELVARVRYNLEETTADYYTDAEIKVWLDAAQLDAIKRIPPSEITELHGSATATASSISLPADYVAPISLAVGASAETVPIVMANSPLNDGSRPNAALDLYGLLDDGKITLPSSMLYVLYYITRPTDITGLTTTAPDIPAKYQYALVLYATYEGLKKDKHITISDKYYRDYLSELGIGGSE